MPSSHKLSSVSIYPLLLWFTRFVFRLLRAGYFFPSFTCIHAPLYSTHSNILVGRLTAVNEIGCGAFSSSSGFIFVRSFVRFSLYLIECFCHLFLTFSIFHQLIDISRLTHTNKKNNNNELRWKKINNREKTLEKFALECLSSFCTFTVISLWLGYATTLVTLHWLHWRCQSAALFVRSFFHFGFRLSFFAPLFVLHYYFVLYSFLLLRYGCVCIDVDVCIVVNRC